MKDKEHTLGSVTVPLLGLGKSRNKFWLPLQPHKRASEAHGSLQLSCWVSSNGEESRGTRKTTGSCANSDIREAGPHSDTEPEAEKVCNAVCMATEELTVNIFEGGGDGARSYWGQS